MTIYYFLCLLFLISHFIPTLILLLILLTAGDRISIPLYDAFPWSPLELFALSLYTVYLYSAQEHSFIFFFHSRIKRRFLSYVGSSASENDWSNKQNGTIWMPSMPLDFIHRVSEKKSDFLTCPCTSPWPFKPLLLDTSEFWKVAIRCSCIFIDVTVTALLKWKASLSHWQLSSCSVQMMRIAMRSLFVYAPTIPMSQLYSD